MSDVKQLLDKFRGAAEIIKMVAETPGVDMLPYANTVSNAIRVLQAADAAGTKIAEHVAAMQETFEGDLPSQEKIAALDAHIEILEAIVDAPLPPKEEGEDD